MLHNRIYKIGFFSFWFEQTSSTNKTPSAQNELWWPDFFVKEIHVWWTPTTGTSSLTISVFTNGRKTGEEIRVGKGYKTPPHLFIASKMPKPIIPLVIQPTQFREVKETQRKS